MTNSEPQGTAAETEIPHLKVDSPPARTSAIEPETIGTADVAEHSDAEAQNTPEATGAAGVTRVSSPGGKAVGTFCPRCGIVVPLELDHCPGCAHQIYHTASKIQRNGLLGGLGFIFLGGILVFLQPRANHTFIQDLFECLIISAVIGAGICFFTAVVDMVRRGGE